MSSDPQNPNDFETTEFETPDAEVSPQADEEVVAQPASDDEAEQTQEAQTQEAEQPKKGKKAKKPKKQKPKKEKKPRAESEGTGSVLGRLFPNVYAVMLAIALVAILIAIAVLVVELSHYDFDIKASTAMGGGLLPVAAAPTTLV